MKPDVDFWITVLARGLVTLLAGSAILIIRTSPTRSFCC